MTIERNIMYGSHADQYGGGMLVSTSGPLLVRNNLVFANSGVMGGAFLDTGDSNFYVTGNTIVGNTGQSPGYAGGLQLVGTLQTNIWISNNILWNNTANGAFDLSLYSAHVRLYNDIGTSSGWGMDRLSEGDKSVDPQFACTACSNFRLKGNSPLIDAGYNGPPGGIGFYDLAGGYRRYGPRVDIGAYEVDRLFANGFE